MGRRINHGGEELNKERRINQEREKWIMGEKNELRGRRIRGRTKNHGGEELIKEEKNKSRGRWINWVG